MLRGPAALTTSQLADPTMASNRAPLHGWRRLSKVAAALQSASPHPTLPTTPAAAEEGRPPTTGMVQRHWDQVVPYVGHESALIWPIFRGAGGNSEPRPPAPSPRALTDSSARGPPTPTPTAH